MISKDQRPETADSNTIDWSKVQRVLVVRLRSIGDTVLSTPSLIALKRFLSDARIDILLENWVAPVLGGFDSVDNVLKVGKSSSERLKTAWRVRRNRYDVVFNLHGGTTGTFFTFASGAPHRVGYSHYQYSFLYNHLLTSASDFWNQELTHSAEQQLALLGLVGVPVDDKPKSRLAVTESSIESLWRKFNAKSQSREDVKNLYSEQGVGANNVRTARISGWSSLGDYALLHPAAAFATKQWAAGNFARVAEHLYERGIKTIAVAARDESSVLGSLAQESTVPVFTFDDLTIPEITALASRAMLFVGNDSGIAHIAAAVGTPSVVIFGSSNRNHWRPWTDAPSEMVFEPFSCQPCPGYECKEFGEPKCILSVRPQAVFDSVERVLRQKSGT